MTMVVVWFHVKTNLFSYYFEMLLPLLKVTMFFCYFLQYDEVSLLTFLEGCYHHLVFMNPVSRCSKLKLLVKVNFIKKQNQTQLCMSLFLISQFSTLNNLQPTCWYSVKGVLSPLCWAYPQLIFFRINW